MRHVLAAIGLMLVVPSASDACSFACDRELKWAADLGDAGTLFPTNAQLLVHVPLESVSDGTAIPLWLGRPDGGDGEQGVPLARHRLQYAVCAYEERVEPTQVLLADTQYRLELIVPDGGFQNPISQSSLTFRTSAGPDTELPPAPALVSVTYAATQCRICGPEFPFGGARVELQPSGGAVWVQPIDPKFDTPGAAVKNGTAWFIVPIACGSVPGLESGTHTMSVIAFDKAWNPSAPLDVQIISSCDGIDPCTGEPIPDAGTPSVNPPSETGCGCGTETLPASVLGALLGCVPLARRARRASRQTSTT